MTLLTLKVELVTLHTLRYPSMPSQLKDNIVDSGPLADAMVQSTTILVTNR